MKIDTFLFVTLQVLIPGSRKSVLLQPLLSDTEYKITVNPIYPEGEDPEGVYSLSSNGHTCESFILSSSATLHMTHYSKMTTDLYV